MRIDPFFGGSLTWPQMELQCVFFPFCGHHVHVCVLLTDTHRRAQLESAVLFFSEELKLASQKSQRHGEVHTPSPTTPCYVKRLPSSCH